MVFTRWYLFITMFALPIDILRLVIASHFFFCQCWFRLHVMIHMSCICQESISLYHPNQDSLWSCTNHWFVVLDSWFIVQNSTSAARDGADDQTAANWDLRQGSWKLIREVQENRITVFSRSKWEETHVYAYSMRSSQLASSGLAKHAILPRVDEIFQRQIQQSKRRLT